MIFNTSTKLSERLKDALPLASKVKKQQQRLFRFLGIIGLVTGLGAIFILLLLTRWSGEFTWQADALRQDFLRQQVTMARHTIEPVIEELRQGRISREEARAQARAILRRMTYRDENGENYIFMSSYQGIMMVQPFEPEKELTSQWDLQDDRGTYIIRELVRTARSHAQGGFFRYYYYRPPTREGFQEKLAFVLPIPELECYVGTGAYLQSSLLAQQRIYHNSLLVAAGFALVILVPGVWAGRLMFLYHHAKVEDQRLESVFNAIQEGLVVHDVEGRILRVNQAFLEMHGMTRDQASRCSIAGDLAGPENPLRQVQAVWRQVLAGSDQCFEWQSRRLDSNLTFWVRVCLHRFHDGEQDLILATVTDQTEERLQQEALLQSEQRYRELVENANCIVLRFNQQGDVTFLNDFATRFFGFAKDELLGQPLVGSIIPPIDSRGKDLRHLVTDIVADPGKFSQNINENMRKDQTRVWVSWSNQVYRSADSGATEVLSIGFDISERMSMEELLRQKDEAWLTALLRFSQMSTLSLQEITDFALEEGIRLTDSSIGYLAFVAEDQQTVTMHSWSRTALAECNVPDKPIIYHLEKMGLWGEAIRQRRPIITNDYSAPNPHKRGQPEGHVTVRRHMNVPIFDEGRIVAVGGVGNKTAEYSEADVRKLTILLDIMWRLLRNLRAEQALQESEHRFRNVAQQTGQLIHDCTVASDKVKWDGAIEKVAATTPEAMQAIRWQDWIAWIHPEDRPRVVAEFEAARAQARSFFLEYRLVLPDRGLQVAHRGIYLRDGHGPGQRLLGTISDISREKAMEASREKLEAQLRQAAKLEAIGRLAGGVAHDFNNILTVINGNVDLAMEETPNHSPAFEMLSEVRAAAQRASSLTHQLLAFSRRQIIEPRVLSLNTVITHMEKMLGRLLGEDIELRIKLDEDTGQVCADPGQLEQILMNLAVNARDAMPNGGILTIETHRMEVDEAMASRHLQLRPGSWALLVVRDSGCGMSSEIQQRLFEPFFTTKELGRGTGLGLATVHGIVQQHRGEIEVNSEIGKGTAFKVFLPRSQEKPMGLAKTDIPSELWSGNETILLVEDDPAVRGLMLQLLKRLGYEARVAHNGQEALAIASDSSLSFDMLVTDVVMPGMNGRELYERMRALRPRIKCLFISGYTQDIIAHHGVLEEGLHYLGKPFTVAQLGKKLREILDPGP